MDLLLLITFSHDNFVIRKYGIKEFRGQFDQTLDFNVSIIRIDKRQMQVNKNKARDRGQFANYDKRKLDATFDTDSSTEWLIPPSGATVFSEEVTVI